MTASDTKEQTASKRKSGVSLHDYLADYLLHWVHSGLNGCKNPAPKNPQRDERIRQLCSLLGEALETGSLCIDLKHLHAEYDWPKAEDVLAEFEQTGLMAGAGKFDAPLASNGALIYLSRHLRYETSIAERILELAKANRDIDPNHNKQITELLSVYFPDEPDKNDEQADLKQEQKYAALTALGNTFTIITGGPGTGKTTTVCKLLAAMLWFEPKLRIVLAAPSGRAAARMADTMAVERAKLNSLADIKTDHLQGLPSGGKTLHRLLRYQPTRDRFRYNNDNKLPFDVVVVDEASMVDVQLFWSLLQALEPKARLILCGDADQLSSVGPGSVFHDLCAMNKERSANASLSALVCKLRRNHRSNETISNLAKCVLDRNHSGVMESLHSDDDSINFIDEPNENWLKSLVLKHSYLFSTDADSNNVDPAAMLQQISNFQVLSPVRISQFGSINLNRIIEAELKRSFAGTEHNLVRKIIITKNDYSLGLFNGDIGFVLFNEEGVPNAYFAGTEANSARRFRLSQLGEYEPAFALTVHKCQGSEFTEVALLLPVLDEEVAYKVNHQLLYTGITRAKEKLHIAASIAAVSSAISRTTARHSDLISKLSNNTN